MDTQQVDGGKLSLWAEFFLLKVFWEVSGHQPGPSTITTGGGLLSHFSSPPTDVSSPPLPALLH